MKTSLSHNIWYDADGTYYVVLDVTQQIGTLSLQIINGVELIPKDEYHVSLVPTSRLTDDLAVREVLIADIEELLRQNPDVVQFESLGTERYFCQKDDEATLIATATVTGLERLAVTVRNRFPEYEVPFAHVTLLKSAKSEYGVGINSRAELEEYCLKL